MNKYLRQFLEYLEIEKNRSPKTIENYRFYLSRFVDWYGNKSPQGITLETVRKYRLWLNRLVDVHGEPLKKNTQNYHLIALRSFLKYLSKIDVKSLAPEKIELMKMPDRDITFLEGNDLHRILEAPVVDIPGNILSTKPAEKIQLAPKATIALRDKAMLETLFSTGLRVSELSKLQIEDINLQKDEFTILGKGGKNRIVFLSEQARFWIRLYLQARHDMNPYLFISHDKRRGNKIKAGASKGKMEAVDEPITPRSIQRTVQKWSKAAGITKPVTPHTLRHSYATDLLQNGADIRSVQSMLGHSSITTTQIYTHITDKELRNVHKKFHNRKKK